MEEQIEQIPIEEISANDDHGKENNVLTLEVLSIIKQSQLQHGLKHGDYQRYRQYCAKRLRRIRKALGFVQSVGSKNRSTYQPKPVTTQVAFDEKNQNSKNAIKYLYIPLICAERSWAYAMQCKQEASTETRRKFHMIRRLRKAVYWSTKLRDLCNDENSRCDARTKLETCAYADYLKGLYHFELDQWQQASDLLNSAQNIYEQLYKVLKDEEIMSLYKQRLDEIKPTLRYCAFNIGEKKIGAKELIKEIKNDQTLSNKIDQLISQTSEKQPEAFDVEWLGKTMFIKHEKILGFLDQLKDPNNDWSQLSFFEQMIFDCRDCLQLLRDNNADKSSQYFYLTYVRLDLIIKRNRLLITTLQNPSDLLRQYEAIIGCYNEIKAMNLSQSFPDSFLVEKFMAEIDAQTVAYKAYRCYYIAHVAKENWKESIAMLNRSAHYCQESLHSEYVSKETKQEIQKLLSKANTETFQIYGENISKDTTESESSSTVLDDKVMKQCDDNYLN
ncbi:hypothetical protein BLA29_001326 [Euroglyphus maynei]|uniref:Signal recognition particle subunit SRP68 n=1 Tax=Euroglyphus maynei TaxID=6958 RepID=A0A1Y3AX57_EURMA|nr:hypothetical protein BLA29_001326 [Euroglyphus maynei]